MRSDEPWIELKGRTGPVTFHSPKDPATVLVVDDDPVMRMLAGQSLELAGFHVEEAEDGTAALALPGVCARMILDAIGPVCEAEPGILIEDPSPRYQHDDRVEREASP